jgi:glycosyltransferase involved in cell wall biosynthesis
MNIRLSILVLSIPERWDKMLKLLNILRPQCNKDDVELLILTDNKKRTIGEKRNEIMSLAKGDYIVFVDDDDMVSNDFVRELLLATRENKDCIVFKELKSKRGRTDMTIHYSINHGDVAKTVGDNIYKKPNSRMCIKRELVKNIKFIDANVSEDDQWGLDISSVLKSETIINKTLYYYFSDYNSTSIRQV